MIARGLPSLSHLTWSLLALWALTPSHFARAAVGCGGAAFCQQPADIGQGAERQDRPDSRLMFSKDVGAVFFPVNPARSDAFEAAMRRAIELLRASADAALRRQGDGCRLLKQHEPARDNSAVYLLLVDPVVREADYSPKVMLGLARREESERLQGDLAAALAGAAVQADYELLLSMAPATPAVPEPASERSAASPAASAAAPPPAQRRAFTGEVGILFNFIKAEKAADFETVMAGLREAFGSSASPARRRQAAGWRVLRQSGDEPAGERVYLFLIDPVEGDADYSPARMLDEALGPDRTAEMIKRYVPAYSRGVSLLNYSVVVPAAKQQ